MTLVDTSVWIDHLRRGNERLKALLLDGQVLVHPYVCGELACGALRNRQQILSLLQKLQQVELAEIDEVMHFVERHRLHGHGLGWVDVNLLASAVLTRCRLWTLDKSLHEAAADLGLDG
jgi:predicted nucleic acid-binding protein